jgi:predicted DNA binding CopG/RHH family protein
VARVSQQYDRPKRSHGRGASQAAGGPRGVEIDMKIVADQVEEDAEVSELVTRLEGEADREIAAGTVTLRWGREQIAVVKRAAALMGVPYQTYLKQVVFRQAVDDIAAIERAGAAPAG